MRQKTPPRIRVGPNLYRRGERYYLIANVNGRQAVKPLRVRGDQAAVELRDRLMENIQVERDVERNKRFYESAEDVPSVWETRIKYRQWSVVRAEFLSRGDTGGVRIVDLIKHESTSDEEREVALSKLLRRLQDVVTPGSTAQGRGARSESGDRALAREVQSEVV